MTSYATCGRWRGGNRLRTAKSRHGRSSSFSIQHSSLRRCSVVQEVSGPSYRRLIDALRRANTIAASTELDALLSQMLDLFVEVANAAAGTLYLYDDTKDELIFKVVKGDPSSQG